MTLKLQCFWFQNTLKHNTMGHIATPKGIDFNIQSTPLTNTERQELSDFIKKRKTQLKKSLSTKKKNKAAIYND